jgi:hypothetical protein
MSLSILMPKKALLGSISPVYAEIQCQCMTVCHIVVIPSYLNALSQTLLTYALQKGALLLKLTFLLILQTLTVIKHSNLFLSVQQSLHQKIHIHC